MTAIALAAAEPDAGFAHGLQRGGVLFQVFKPGGVEFAKQALAADDVAGFIDGGLGTLAGGRLEIGGGGRLDAEIGRALDDGVGQRVLGLRFKRGGDPQQMERVFGQRVG